MKQNKVGKKKKNKKKNNQENIDVPIEFRYDWMSRLYGAIKIDSENSTGSLESDEVQKNIEVKYTELRNVCNEFLDVATADAIIIINEHFQPKFRKTISVHSEKAVDGRAQECGRGDNGKSYLYESHNICYNICIDYDGIFNGSDEYASKSAGNERRGSQEYLRLQIPKLCAPLVCTIDYLGFRILAVTNQPIMNISFTADGEIQKISEDLVHGCQKKGETFVNKSKSAQALLKKAAAKLNLAEHCCKGLRDITSSSTYGAADMKIYKKTIDGDDIFFVRDFWTSFPPEIPTKTLHLSISPRDQRYRNVII
jgi:hypothetical protein